MRARTMPPFRGPARAGARAGELEALLGPPVGQELSRVRSVRPAALIEADRGLDMCTPNATKVAHSRNRGLRGGVLAPRMGPTKLTLKR